MSKDINLDQESYNREEKKVFHGSEAEMLKCIQTLVCFTNYKGGKFLVKEVRKREFLQSFFDAAILEKKINSYIEPPISGIISVNNFNQKKGVKIRIEESNRNPHFYKTDGYFINIKKEKIVVFQRGSIGVRRSAENDIFNSKDFDLLLKNKLSEIFGGIQKVVVKHPTSDLLSIIGKLKRISSEIVTYKYNPDDPEAVSIKQVLDTEPFNNLTEELNASVKFWKTNRTLFSDILIAKSYINSKKINNKEHLKLLLLSSLEKRLPSYLWASKIKKSELKILLTNIVKKDLFPSVYEALKLTSVLPYKFAKETFNLANSSRYLSIKTLLGKIEKINLKDKNRVESIKKFLFNTNLFNDIKKPEIIDIVNRFISSDKKEKNVLKNIWRILDLEIFGRKLLK